MTACEDLLSKQNIIERIRLGEDKAFAVLLEVCMPMIRQETARFRFGTTDEDDFAQEAAVGLLSAAKAYREDGGASFMTFARLCVRRRLINALRLVSDTEIPCESPFSLSENEIDANILSPDRLLLDKEEEVALLNKMKSLLSDTEYRVLVLHMASYSYNEIAQTLQISSKAVDNALQRIRRKLRKSL